MKRKAFVFAVMMVLLASTAWAASCPSLVDLGGIPGGPRFEAMRSDTDSLGNTYVTDRWGDYVVVYGRNGKAKNYFSIEKPLGLAIDSSDNIYIGRATDFHGGYAGEVGVYDSNFNLLYKLGKGWGEFSYPIDIMIHDGKVYVVDNRYDAVKVYNQADGSPLFNFGGTGTADKNLSRPTAIAVHPNGQYLYVTDRAVKLDQGSYVLTAGVKKFSMTGTYVSKFNLSYGWTGALGTMGVPSGIYIDSSSRVYITDMSTDVMQIFTDAGAGICTTRITKSFQSTKGIEATEEGKLLISADQRVFIYGLDNYVNLTVSPTSLGYDSQACGSSNGTNTLTIGNNGPGTLSWSASADASWVSLSQESGSIAGQGSDSVAVNVDASALSVGTHTANIKVASPGASETVSVTVVVSAAPTLEVVGGGFEFSVKGNDIPAADSFSVKLSGDNSGSLTWSAAADSSWISVSPASGPSGALGIASVGVSSAGLSGLAAGSHTGTVKVSASCDLIAPITMDVALSYIKGGTIQVETNAAEANFTVSGAETYAGSGTLFVVDGVPEGTYEVRFEGMQGFKAPSSQVVSVVNGQTSTVSASYIDLRERKSIITTMGGGKWYTDNTVNVYSGAGELQGSIVMSAAAASTKGKTGADITGSATAAGDVDGDGIDEIIVAHDNGMLSGFYADGTSVAGLSFKAFEYDSDIQLAMADLNGDGIDEIVVGAGNKSGLQSAIRVFGYNAADGAAYDTGINFLAYQGRNGVNVAAGDVDGDGADEIVTAEGGNGKTTASIRIWGVVLDQDGGTWDVEDAGGFSAGTTYYGAFVAVADLNADAVDEIIVSVVPNNSDKMASITAYNASGATIVSFMAPGKQAVEVAAGDTDFDGNAEIVLGDGADSLDSTTKVMVYNADGTFRTEFQAFNSSDKYGARVSLGQTVGQ